MDQSTGTERRTVGRLPTETARPSARPRRLTRAVWLLWLASLAALAVRLRTGQTWELWGLFAVDGLTAVMWVAVTFFSGVVHSYSRRYMAGDPGVERFFARAFGFTLTVMVLVAAAHLALFAAAWLVMGLVMASLVGHVRGWPHARAAAARARRYLLASSALVAVAVAVLWLDAGVTTTTGLAAAAPSVSPTAAVVAAGALLLAAMVQSALVPFHTWLLSSMTAPTPASALMHAGFVNAGGVLLVRFAPVVTLDPGVMLAVLVVGAASALLGKLLKSVQTDVKRRLGCSTVGQMGFMLLQVGLGFFAAAITHLVLHGCYKAYQFLSAGSAVERASPTATSTHREGPVGLLAAALTALAGGAVFAALTGKGTSLDGGLLLVLFVVLTTLHAAREAIGRASLSPAVRYAAVPAVALPAIGVYAAVYRFFEAALAPDVVAAPTDLTAVHGAVAAAVVLAYLALDRGVHRQSRRLYVALLNRTQPPADTLLTTREAYDDH